MSSSTATREDINHANVGCCQTMDDKLKLLCITIYFLQPPCTCNVSKLIVVNNFLCSYFDYYIVPVPYEWLGPLFCEGPRACGPIVLVVLVQRQDEL